MDKKEQSITDIFTIIKRNKKQWKKFSNKFLKKMKSPIFIEEAIELCNEYRIGKILNDYYNGVEELLLQSNRGSDRCKKR